MYSRQLRPVARAKTAYAHTQHVYFRPCERRRQAPPSPHEEGPGETLSRLLFQRRRRPCAGADASTFDLALGKLPPFGPDPRGPGARGHSFFLAGAASFLILCSPRAQFSFFLFAPRSLLRSPPRELRLALHRRASLTAGVLFIAITARHSDVRVQKPPSLQPGGVPLLQGGSGASTDAAIALPCVNKERKSRGWCPPGANRAPAVRLPHLGAPPDDNATRRRRVVARSRAYV